LARGRIEREPIDLRKACSETVSRVPLPGADKADDRRRRLLRARHEGPSGHRAEQRYEFAPPLVEHGAFFLRWAP